jgi:hypothetical protein
VDAFLATSVLVDHHHPAVCEFSATVSRSTEIETVRSAYEAVRDRFPHSYDIRAQGVLVVSVLVRAGFSVGEESSGGDISRPRNLGCVTRYRWFESGFLQRGVQCEPDFRGRIHRADAG